MQYSGHSLYQQVEQEWAYHCAGNKHTRQLHVDQEYEEVDTLQSQTIQLKENVAYGPVKQSQKIELKENVAYGPVKQSQEIELKENVAYGPVKRN